MLCVCFFFVCRRNPVFFCGVLIRFIVRARDRSAVLCGELRHSTSESDVLFPCFVCVCVCEFNRDFNEGRLDVEKILTVGLRG